MKLYLTCLLPDPVESLPSTVAGFPEIQDNPTPASHKNPGLRQNPTTMIQNPTSITGNCSLSLQFVTKHQTPHDHIWTDVITWTPHDHSIEVRLIVVASVRIWVV